MKDIHDTRCFRDDIENKTSEKSSAEEIGSCHKNRRPLAGIEWEE